MDRVWTWSTGNGIDSIDGKNRLKVRLFESHDGVPAASEFVKGNAALTHVTVQRAGGNVKEFRRLGFVEQPVVIMNWVLHDRTMMKKCEKEAPQAELN